MTTEAGVRATTLHREQQQTLRAATLRDLVRIWRGVDPTNLRGTIGPFTEAASILVRARFANSAGLAAAYFQEFRRLEGITGSAVVVTPDPPDEETVAATVRGAGLSGIVNARRAGFPVQAAADNGFVKVAGAAASLVLSGGRQTITEASVGDRNSSGWERVTSGENCDWCNDLAGVVFSDETRFQAHDHCNCSPQPVFVARAGQQPERPSVRVTSRQDDVNRTNRERLAPFQTNPRPGIDDNPEIVAAARRKFDEALAKESEISGVLGDVQEKTGATFQHYGERVKYESSIRDKIFRELQADPSLTVEEAADQITDTNRYTMIWEADNAYRANQASAVKAMNDSGWETIADKNAWAPGGTYNGMNYKFQRGEDIVELQFHTPASAVIKDQSHILYTEARTMPPGPEKDALGEQIVNLWNEDGSHIPPNMEDVGTPVFYGLDL